MNFKPGMRNSIQATSSVTVLQNDLSQSVTVDSSARHIDDVRTEAFPKSEKLASQLSK